MLLENSLKGPLKRKTLPNFYCIKGHFRVVQISWDQTCQPCWILSFIRIYEWYPEKSINLHNFLNMYFGREILRNTHWCLRVFLSQYSGVTLLVILQGPFVVWEICTGFSCLQGKYLNPWTISNFPLCWSHQTLSKKSCWAEEIVDAYHRKPS